MRSLMHNFNSSSFQLGQYVSALNMAEHLLSTDMTVCTGSVLCENGHVLSASILTNRQLTQSFFLLVTVESCRSIQEWINQMKVSTQRLCVVCQEPLVVRHSVATPAPMLCFEISDQTHLHLNLSILVTIHSSNSLTSVGYRLAAIVYFGSGHFTLRYIAPCGTVYYHDGLRGNEMDAELTPISLLDLAFCTGKTASLAIYTLSEPVDPGND